jgi:signal transduction histidine kinase
MASLEQSAAEKSKKSDPVKHVSPAVAHELNNLLTIIQGHADRMLFRHGEEPAIAPHLKVISDAVKRAANIIREATPPTPSLPLQPIPPQQQQTPT